MATVVIRPATVIAASGILCAALSNFVYLSGRRKISFFLADEAMRK